MLQSNGILFLLTSVTFSPLLTSDLHWRLTSANNNTATDLKFHHSFFWMVGMCVLQTWSCLGSIQNGFDVCFENLTMMPWCLAAFWKVMMLCFSDLILNVVFGTILTGCDVCCADLNLIRCLATFWLVLVCMLQTSRRQLLYCWRASWLGWTG